MSAQGFTFQSLLYTSNILTLSFSVNVVPQAQRPFDARGFANPNNSPGVFSPMVAVLDVARLFTQTHSHLLYHRGVQLVDRDRHF